MSEGLLSEAGRGSGTETTETELEVAGVAGPAEEEGGSVELFASGTEGGGAELFVVGPAEETGRVGELLVNGTEGVESVGGASPVGTPRGSG